MNKEQIIKECVSLSNQKYFDKNSKKYQYNWEVFLMHKSIEQTAQAIFEELDDISYQNRENSMIRQMADSNYKRTKKKWVGIDEDKV